MRKLKPTVVSASADAMLPPNGPIPVSGTEAGLVEYFDEYCKGQSWTQRVLLRLLLVFIQLSPLVFGPRFTAFTRLTQEARVRAFEAMEKAASYFRRVVVFQSLRFILTNGYFADPRVNAIITRKKPGNPAKTRPLIVMADTPNHEPDAPHRGVKVFNDYSGPIKERCQVLVVGSGPGGAVVAKRLAVAGYDVILAEEGPPMGARDFRPDAGATMSRLFREQGARVALGKSAIPTLQAKVHGGGSVVNSAICARAPAFTFDTWNVNTGVELTRSEIDPNYDDVERELGVEATPCEVYGERNLRFKAGCDALDMSSEPTHRNVRGCKGSGECFSGCRNVAKGSVDRNYMPSAIKAGARVYTSIRVERVLHNGHKARGIVGHVVEPFTGKVSHEVEIRADIVVLAAGCMQTPVIMQRSDLGGRWVGNDLQFHPGLAVMAMYDEVIDPWFGATQGYHSLHHIKEGIKLEVLWAPPAILATRLPGVGHEYQRNLLNYDRMAPFDVITAANKSRGRVRTTPFSWNPRISYELHQDDMNLLMKGLAILTDVGFASGAVGVLPGIHGVPDILRKRADADILRTRTFSPRDAIIGSNHAFGTTRMSKLPKDGVVDGYGRHHQVRNLYISDTGIIPGSPGVNPMLTVMALADRVAKGIIEGR